MALTDGLVFYLPLWSRSLQGSPIVSKDIYAHSCAITGATWGVQGRTLDGSTDLITTNSAAAGSVLNITGSMTILAWIYPHSVSGNQLIVARWNEGAAKYTYFLNLAGSQLEWVHSNGAGDDLMLSAVSSVVANTFQQVGAVRNGSNVIGFVNGAQKLSPAQTVTPLAQSFATTIGSR